MLHTMTKTPSTAPKRQDHNLEGSFLNELGVLPTNLIKARLKKVRELNPHSTATEPIDKFVD